MINLEYSEIEVTSYGMEIVLRSALNQREYSYAIGYSLELSTQERLRRSWS